MAEEFRIEGLRYALEVVDTGSFTAAARRLGVTQPALSNGIAKLESRLGGPLFLRSPRGVTPTPMGHAILPLLEQAVSAVDAITAEARRWSGPAADDVRLGVSPLINPGLVSEVKRTLHAISTPHQDEGTGQEALTGSRSAPGPSDTGLSGQLVLTEANLDELLQGLEAGELDVLIIPSVGPLPRWEQRIVDSEPLVLVDPEAGGHDAASLHDLIDARLILLPDTCGLTKFTRDLFGARSIPLRTYPGEASSYRVLEDWSKLGLGSALLPESKVSGSDYRLLHDEEGLIVEIFYQLVWDPRSPLAGHLDALGRRLGDVVSA
ncbi:DNA-binding transcriptional LysR family regulator [Brevibacterium sanguinis]|uniref:DNA-binding transcriptional LysR family regulator n=2 Tax=Brevibacterium TaxID=1696 RepID=A0A366IDZ6_9MICO|nr:MULTISPECIES: LysR family transcriptional regulator [Brevibacterium]RBP62562.1 DNA-binding transcriptional LysR family regulator [Brevibacterium sanguinis]RBP69226.1 DNA-binding transcriptional LysR family regulator [Brevibacterium celere]